MSKEKQIEEMSCKKCLHYEMCLDNFRGAKEEGLWELTEEDEYFAHADECDFYAAGYRKQSEGEWMKPQFFARSGFYTKKEFPCNQCGETFEVVKGSKLMHYCPNCGAKMKGGEE